MSTSTQAADINALLNDKLFQVIGSTPASIAESLRKVDLKGKTAEAAQIFAVCVFAAAVNKSTLETFLADPRFAGIRPILNACMSIQGRSNMTSLTLLGHCLLTTETSSSVVFTSEFKKKMGQDHLWAGSLDAGSLSEKQRGILKEKKRITPEEDAKALGSGFLKHTGIIRGELTGLEIDFFGGVNASSAAAPAAATEPRPRTTSILPPVTTSVPAREIRRPSGAGRAEPSRARKSSSPDEPVGSSTFRVPNASDVQIPNDVLNYRRNILQQSDVDIADSIERRTLATFIANTRTIMEQDPDGSRTRGASLVADK